MLPRMGSSVRFVYRDAHGNITGRKIEDRTDSEDHIQGICLERGDLRTFRLDRVLEYVDRDTDLDERVRYHREASPPPTELLSRPRPTRGAMEVCFTGFSAAVRASLEDAARTSGMFIRGDVTKNLSVLCCGSKAGPSKVQKARQLGVLALSEEQFRQYLVTGEIPE